MRLLALAMIVALLGAAYVVSGHALAELGAVSIGGGYK